MEFPNKNPSKDKIIRIYLLCLPLELFIDNCLSSRAATGRTMSPATRLQRFLPTFPSFHKSKSDAKGLSTCFLVAAFLNTNSKLCFQFRRPLASMVSLCVLVSCSHSSFVDRAKWRICLWNRMLMLFSWEVDMWMDGWLDDKQSTKLQKQG